MISCSRWLARLLAGILVVSCLVRCQLAPTRSSSRQSRPLEILVDKSKKPVAVTEQTVVLDARDQFEYGLNRILNSHHFPWENLAENRKTGEPLRDQRKAAQRLALLGITLATPIVVVGVGPAGDGEEGRLAWNLMYLGFQDVQVASIDLFRQSLTQTPTPPPRNVPLWKPNILNNMIVDKAAFKKLAMDPKGRIQKKIHFIDVRSTDEYFNKSKAVKAVPDVNAIHIDWKEFFTPTGRPNLDLKKRLQALGVGTNDRIITISQRGVRSSAAAYALMALGFTNVQNYISGWQGY